MFGVQGASNSQGSCMDGALMRQVQWFFRVSPVRIRQWLDPR